MFGVASLYVFSSFSTVTTYTDWRIENKENFLS